MHWSDFEVDGERFTAEQQEHAFRTGFRGSKRVLAARLGRGRGDVGAETMARAAGKVLDRAKADGRAEWTGSHWEVLG